MGRRLRWPQSLEGAALARSRQPCSARRAATETLRVLLLRSPRMGPRSPLPHSTPSPVPRAGPATPRLGLARGDQSPATTAAPGWRLACESRSLGSPWSGAPRHLRPCPLGCPRTGLGSRASGRLAEVAEDGLELPGCASNDTAVMALERPAPSPGRMRDLLDSSLRLHGSPPTFSRRWPRPLGTGPRLDARGPLLGLHNSPSRLGGTDDPLDRGPHALR